MPWKPSQGVSGALRVPSLSLFPLQGLTWQNSGQRWVSVHSISVARSRAQCAPRGRARSPGVTKWRLTQALPSELPPTSRVFLGSREQAFLWLVSTLSCLNKRVNEQAHWRQALVISRGPVARLPSYPQHTHSTIQGLLSHVPGPLPTAHCGEVFPPCTPNTSSSSTCYVSGPH